MSDWVIDDDQGKNTQNLNASEWEIVPEETQSPIKEESYWEAMKSAPDKIISDVSNKVAEGVNAIPDYFQKAKSEVPALLNPFAQWRENPLHVAGQGLAGINEGINAVAQFPLDLARYGSGRLGLTPQGLTNFIEKITPEDTTQSINQLFGQPQYPGEALLRGTARNILPISGIAKLVKAAPHLTKRGATRTLKQARQLAQDRNIGTLNVDPAIIEDARQFLPNTLPNRTALDTAKLGDYNSLFRLQSDLGKSAGDYAKSFFSAAERSHGRAGMQTRNRLLDAIHENLQAQGHHDISTMLRQGQRDYRRYMKFKPYRNILGLAGLGMLLPENSLVNIANKILSHKTQ